MVSHRRMAVEVQVGFVLRRRPDRGDQRGGAADPRVDGVRVGGQRPGQVGLYAAPLALVGYAMFGGSRVMVYAAAGSVAAVSASVVAGLNATSPTQAVAFTAALAVAAGLVFIVAGLAKMGWILNFMSKAVMAGFITGMAIQIIVGQIGNITGVKASSGNTFQKLWSELSHIGDWNWTSTVLGLLAIALIFGIQRFMKLVPAALTAVVLASIYVAIANPTINLVAKIPKGLPSFTVPTRLSWSTWGTLLLGGAVVALVGFSEGWARPRRSLEPPMTTSIPTRSFGRSAWGWSGPASLEGCPSPAACPSRRPPWPQAQSPRCRTASSLWSCF